MTGEREEVWITGLGLVSSVGEGGEAHLAHLARGGPPVLDEERFAPYPVHPLPEIDFSRQIPKRGDLRQMEAWQRIGTYAAGLALEDAGIKGEEALLSRTGLIVAAGSGERDTRTDQMVLEAIAGESAGADDSDSEGGGAAKAILPNEILPSELRPTLFLAQLSNLLAGNISIVHKVTGSSRTFMGEEMAGVAAAEIALKRIGHGQDRIILVGGACNGEREDMLLIFELGHNLLRGAFAPVWERQGAHSGFVMGSQGAFLVLEARSHAEARGAKPYARLSGVTSGRCRRAGEGEAAQSAREQFARLARETRDLAPGPLPVLSGASGTRDATREERAFLEDLGRENFDLAVRAFGSALGHGVEAHFPMGLALAALLTREGAFPPPLDESGMERPLSGAPERILVTGFGHWRGEGLALVEPAM